MTDRATLENELRDALIAALGISYPLERIVDDLAISRPEIVAAVRFNQAVQLDATQLIRVCWEFDDGLASLREVALAALKGRRGLPRLSKAFQECLAAQVEESGQDSFSPLISRNRYQAKDLPAWRNSLSALAARYPDVDDVLHDALDRALREKLGEVDIRSRCPFLSSGRIKGWSDLLARNGSSNDCLDPALIDALDRQLKKPPPAPSSRVGSLVVMLLDLGNKNYGYRAYVCLSDLPEVSDWKMIADRPQEEIKGEGWRVALEERLPAAIGEAGLRLQQRGIFNLLVEVFLPLKLLNEDIGSLSLPPHERSEKRKDLRYLYPYVLRSSERYQMFMESRQCVTPRTLPLRWEALHDPDIQVTWRHDHSFSRRLKSEKSRLKAREELETWFSSIQSTDTDFAIKRIANLPGDDDPQSCHLWLEELINACPAVALWWRPCCSASIAQRKSFFSYPGECAQSPFGKAPAPSIKKGDPGSDHESFVHRCGPLELFHTLARTVKLRLTQPKLKQVSEALVLLVDSHDRWPPALEEPLKQKTSRPSEGQEPVLEVDRDNISIL